MRYRETFSLHPRTTKSGKKIWYYQTYDEEGNRTTARSTGLTSKTAARNLCNELHRKNQLLPKKDMTFTDFAKNWWIPGRCRYLKAKIARGDTISKQHTDICRLYTEIELLPHFGRKKLKSITTGMIENWLLNLPDKRKITAVTANKYLGVLRVMLNEAERLGLISQNPITNKIRELKEKPKARGILTRKEFKRLFDPDKIDQIWMNKVLYTMNMLSALTGMRMGEVQALQVCDVHAGYVHVHQSLGRDGVGLKSTKTGDIRNIVIPEYLSVYLKEQKQENSSGFIFSYDGGQTPVHNKSLTRQFYRALRNIGITDEIRRERNITFHSWRHFLNSTMRSNNIADSKVQKLTGHRTDAMTERYTHFDVGDFQDVLRIQESLL